MILVIRGHIRDSFKDRDLLKLIKRIINDNRKIEIYIHTWNVFSTKVSWRNYVDGHEMIEDNNVVTEEIVMNYFNDIKKNIRKVIIEDDSNLELFGSLEGNVCNSMAPKKGWKNYIYGNYSIFNYLYNNKSDLNEVVVNLRFDILDIHIIGIKWFSLNSIMKYIRLNTKPGIIYDNIIFPWDIILNESKMGSDNIYISTLGKVYELLCALHFKLDKIESNFMRLIHQEHLVNETANILFASDEEVKMEIFNTDSQTEIINKIKMPIIQKGDINV